MGKRRPGHRKVGGRMPAGGAGRIPPEVRAAVDVLGWQLVRRQQLGKQVAFLVMTDEFILEPYDGATLIAMAGVAA